MNTHRKGSRWRHQVEDWLRAGGWVTRFRGIGDAGDDITAMRYGHELSVECKNQQRLELANWVDQAERNAPAHAVPVLVVHRRGRAGVDHAYVVLSGSAFRRLVGR